MTDGERFQIREPAVAGAVSRCLIARAFGFPETVIADHDRACGWEDYPTAVLRASIADYVVWAEYARSERQTGRYVADRFNELSLVEQKRLIAEAQAFPDPAASAAAPTPAQPATPEPDGERAGFGL